MMELIDVPKWIEKNQFCFLPPICNKMMFNDQLKVFFVGGPNERSDYHIELGEEFFYQIKGDMCLNVVERGQHKSIHIRQGEAFLLPARIPHSPQRKANTMGLVIERRRENDELDGLRYYVPGAKNILYERWFYCEDLGTQLAPIIKEFLQSNEHKTGIPSTNSRLIEAPYCDDATACLVDPISVSKWLKCYEEEIDELGHKALFDSSMMMMNKSNSSNFTTRVHIYGGNFKHLITSGDQYEIFLWQMIGTAKVFQLDQGNDDNNDHNNNNDIQWVHLKSGHCLKVPTESKIQLETQSGCFTLVLSMPPPSSSSSY